MTKYFKSRICREDIQTDALSTKKFARFITQAETLLVYLVFYIFNNPVYQQPNNIYEE
jgi:hypothetical protein